jgi:hypothetical protein
VTHARRYTRYRIRTEVVVRYGGLPRDLCTEDISYGGMFVATDVPAPVRDLIRIEVPGVRTRTGEPLRLCAMVAHVVEPGAKRRPGMGLQLYGLGRDERVAWVSFVDKEAAAAPDRPVADSTPLILDGIAGAGAEPAVRIIPDDVAELNELYSRLLTERTVIVASAIEVAPRELLRCDLVHPSSRRELSVPLTVLRQVIVDRRPAFLVRLDDPEGLTAAGLWRFISTAEAPEVRNPLATPFTEDELGALDLSFCA